MEVTGDMRQIGKAVLCARLVLILPVFVAMMVMLVGCDAFYEVTIENHTDQDLTVHFLGRERRMRPCSVLSESSLSGPPANAPVDVEAKNAAGETIFESKVRPERGQTGFPQLYIRIPAIRQETCRAPVSGIYTLTVENHTHGPVQLWLGEEHLGSVETLETQTFGPLPGNWRDARKIHVRDVQGREEELGYWSPTEDYDLGEIPQVFVFITGEIGQ